MKEGPSPQQPPTSYVHTRAISKMFASLSLSFVYLCSIHVNSNHLPNAHDLPARYRPSPSLRRIRSLPYCPIRRKSTLAPRTDHGPGRHLTVHPIHNLHAQTARNTKIEPSRPVKNFKMAVLCARHEVLCLRTIVPKQSLHSTLHTHN